jgi:hypothetical protein
MDRSRAELLVGPELGGVVQLPQRAVAGVGGMIPGVVQDILWCSSPPAELAHPDITLLRPVPLLPAAELAVRPRPDHLAGFQDDRHLR